MGAALFCAPSRGEAPRRIVESLIMFNIEKGFKCVNVGAEGKILHAGKYPFFGMNITVQEFNPPLARANLHKKKSFI